MKVLDISGKKILFFSPAFFNYECVIADKMREMGAIVDMYDSRCITSAVNRSLLKVFPNIFNNKSREYYDNILNKNKGKNYDYILIIKCDMTPISTLKQLRIEFPNAKLCLYLYDSIDNIPGIKDKFEFFDILHSFDLNDCKKYKFLNFRPLFFADQFRMSSKSRKKFKYDICFLGTIHSDRYAVIQQIQKIANVHSLRCYWFLYLQSKFIYWFYKVSKKEFRKAKMNDFSFDKKSLSEISEIESESRVILDIQHPKQTGLTMRTIEMVGMNKKLITTNESIKYYDFYDPNNIAIIDRNNISLDINFLKSPYKPLQKSVLEKYSLRTWILDILN